MQKNINDNPLPEGDHGVVYRPPDDEGGGGVHGHLRHIRDARGEPDVRERNLQRGTWISDDLQTLQAISNGLRFIIREFPILPRVVPLELAQ